MNYNDPLQRDEPITIHTNKEKDSVIIRGRTSTAKFVNFLGALPDGGRVFKWFSQCYNEGYRQGQVYLHLYDSKVATWDGCFGQKTLRRLNKRLKTLHFSIEATILCLELRPEGEAEDTDEWYNLALSRVHNQSQDGEETIEVEI